MSFIFKTESFVKLKQTATQLRLSDEIYTHDWLYDKEDLMDLISHFQEEEVCLAKLAQMGGPTGLGYALRTDLVNGLGEDELKLNDFGEGEGIAIRRNLYGRNEIPRQPSPPFWKLCAEQLEDPMLIVLCVAGAVSITLGAIEHPEDGWLDGLAILLAVAIVVLVGGLNDWQKEKQFRAMEAESANKSTMVKRAGKNLEVNMKEVVVGDLCVLRAGFQIPCDGVYVHGTENLKTEEAGLTGETKEIKKGPRHPLILGGTQVVQGDGLMLAVCVGEQTEWGKLMKGVEDERDETPLQQKLNVLATYIGYGGAGAAIALFSILIIRWGILTQGRHPEEILTMFIIAVTIVVVAVPEGLPLAVTISLAYSMKKMLSDNNFVRVLSACETMGNATTICSDKTGTLTQNLMSVTKVFISSRYWDERLPTRQDLADEIYEIVSACICCNSKAELQPPQHPNDRARLAGGNQTECAMLQWVMDLGANYETIRDANPIAKFYPFDSAVKRSSVLIHGDPDRYTMYVKGAAEQILALCDSQLNENGEIVLMEDEDRADVIEHLGRMTRVGLRCLGICYKDYDAKEIVFKSGTKEIDDDACDLFTNMTWISVCGIKDPVRPEVPSAVKTCQQAGVIVRMVTGDHIDTAKFIARECGILSCSSHICMTGGEFRTLTDEQKDNLLPNLRVLARSKPSDKEALVVWYRDHDHVVAVTGDGANDALALAKADVGLSMGIQGTDVAKEASDIIIMDDNFASIEKTVMWGRSVYDNIRKFVQFQLTVNVVALTLTLIAAFFDEYKNPLNAVQLLWVNLIMDTMAALALATETPTVSLLERFPFKKESSLIAKVMWRFILGHSVLQLIVLFTLMFSAERWFDLTADKHYDQQCLDSRRNDSTVTCQNMTVLTLVFNTFVWLQIFNEVNARRVNNEWNVFERFFGNYVFIGILAITVFLQFIMVEFLGDFFRTKPLFQVAPELWGVSIGFGFLSLPWNQVVRLLPVDLKDGYIEFDAESAFKRDPAFDLNSVGSGVTPNAKTIAIPVDVPVTEAK